MTPTRYTIRQLIARHPCGLRIASFQRHYVWGQFREGEKDSAAFLTECLLKAYKDGDCYFLQSITVYESLLVDGQQRITYLYLLLSYLGADLSGFRLKFDNRPEAQQWFERMSHADYSDNPKETSQDIYFYKLTMRHFAKALADIDREDFKRFALDCIYILYISLPEYTNVITIYKMMNGTKVLMQAPDLIKADLMRIASTPGQPDTEEWRLNTLRARYASEWESWVRWWGRKDVAAYYSTMGRAGIELLIKLCLRGHTSPPGMPLTYEEFRKAVNKSGLQPYHGAKHIFYNLRQIQRRIEEAFEDTTAYNRIKAILLLQSPEQSYRFLHSYFAECTIDRDELIRYYKLSFLGMTTDEIEHNESASERFDDMLASLSMADVYHSDAKREVFNLLLRLNIDEDIKLGRRFDFTVWNNRSLEHIYSKSKVWHLDENERVLDGNDNDLRTTRRSVEKDPTYMHRDKIVNYDGAPLSEHCIGNLVLLYGENNATFGNATFEQKKMMFLTPGDQTVFQSRNLLHSVCVFAGKTWDHRSIIDNYNLTLKNLKAYYGYK